MTPKSTASHFRIKACAKWPRRQKKNMGRGWRWGQWIRFICIVINSNLAPNLEKTPSCSHSVCSASAIFFPLNSNLMRRQRATRSVCKHTALSPGGGGYRALGPQMHTEKKPSGFLCFHIFIFVSRSEKILHPIELDLLMYILITVSGQSVTIHKCAHFIVS